MACELSTQKRTCEESYIPSKNQRLEELFNNENLETDRNMHNLMLTDILNPNDDSFHALSVTIPTSDLTPAIIPKAEMKRDPSSTSLSTYDDDDDDATSSYVSTSDFASSKDFLNEFFIDFNLQNMGLSSISSSLINSPPSTDQIQEPSTNMNSVNEGLQSLISPEICKSELTNSINNCLPYAEEVLDLSSNKTYLIDELQSITPPKNKASNNRHNIKNRMPSYKTLFHKELGDFMFMTLKLHNNQYYVYIKYDETNRQTTSLKNGIVMNIKCWYEFQYKILAFNLKYESSSFVVNNSILVLNNNNLSMTIKNLKNYFSIELNEYQLENLKGIHHDFNKKLIHHMYTIHLPYLIRRKCILRSSPQEETLSTLKILYTCIEENLKTIIYRIYECSACILGYQSQDNSTKSLHPCLMFNTREKYNQLGERVLMLVNFDFVISTFSNRVHHVDECLLCDINVETIHNVLFNSLK